MNNDNVKDNHKVTFDSLFYSSKNLFIVTAYNKSDKIK